MLTAGRLLAGSTIVAHSSRDGQLLSPLLDLSSVYDLYADDCALVTRMQLLYGDSHSLS